MPCIMGSHKVKRMHNQEQETEQHRKAVELVASGNEQAFQVHEQLKSGELQVGDMSAEQKTLMNNINWQATVSETFEGYSFKDARHQAMPRDRDWMSSMERTATVEMGSPGGLKLEFGIATQSSNAHGMIDPYRSVDTLREFYSCNVAIDGDAAALVNDKPISPSDLFELVDELRDHWESAALQEVGQLPVEYEAIADRTFADLAIDDTLEVSRNEAGDIAVSFSVEEPSGVGSIEFTMKAGEPNSLTSTEDPSGAVMSLAKTYVTENEQLLSAQVDTFKLQEVGLSSVEIDHEEGAYFATFKNGGENGFVGLDSENLKIDSSSPGYDKLSEAQVEVLSAEITKQTEGMTPPMGVEVAERKAQELGELRDKDMLIVNNGDSFALYEGERGQQPVKHQGNYGSSTALNQALDGQILEARESLSIEREKPAHEIERQRQEEPERRGIRL